MKLFDEKAGTKFIKLSRPVAHREGVAEEKYDKLDAARQARATRGEGNLGFGYLYYGLVRIYQPRTILSIGSGFGFVPMLLALGARDNGVGHVHFVDPSLQSFHMCDIPEQVIEHFGKAGLDETWFTHYKLTNREFREQTNVCERGLDLLFIDGSDKKADVEFDFFEIGSHVKKGGFILMHDTDESRKLSYHEPKLVKSLKEDAYKNKYDVIRFPGGAGFSIIRILG
jgi:predicted O-methyltransferase YrrM